MRLVGADDAQAWSPTEEDVCLNLQVYTNCRAPSDRPPLFFSSSDVTCTIALKESIFQNKVWIGCSYDVLEGTRMFLGEQV